ncbi:Por secretion system protein [Prevotella communis]|uniref:type IX secretion system anionic LPS delivery protein PorZ n=1 Tax=Prevotella communis TaxID=2913614 RepID=UPI001EDC6D8F|nr:two-component regulator propeller domain-containing protein [Prevotella communis]UKK62201.1 Por secretion system protein [Prevotella communis]UKK65028.1 Por secretion system protein [Prevotella communis]UKK67414.1 Por secretion system protein [Prevotella communis]
MKRLALIVFLIAQLSIINCQLSIAQIGTWRAFMSYYEPQQIIKAGSNTLFVRASNSLYSYHLNDHSITTYDKVNPLSDTYISYIAWSQQAKRLIIVYQNGNIDLMDLQENVTNISSLYTKTLTESKTVNNVYIHQQYAYLCMPFGVIKVNMERAEISETYMLNQNIQAVAIDNTSIYARNDQGTVYSALLSTNLIDKSNWNATDTYPAFTTDTADWDAYIDIVKTLKPDGPYYNQFYESKIVNGKLYTTGGAFRSGQIALNNPGIIQEYDFDTWTIYPTNINEITGFNYMDINCVDIDPTDNSRVMAAGRCGLYEFKNGVLENFYYKENSPLRPVTSSSTGKYLTDDYTLVHGIKFDNDGNLWVLNSQANNVNLLEFTKSGQWISHYKNELCYKDNTSMSTMRCLLFDSQGLLWFINTHFNSPCIICYDKTTDKVLIYSSFTNQDGTNYENCYPYDIQEDYQGNIWIATNQGPFYIKKEEKGQSNATLYQEKVPRNDGTNYADYLLSGIHTNGIAIDGGGRKWFATIGNGVFLVSEDNMTQLQHFTAENSPLLSNNVQYISINHSSGEVFFLTDKGLCSYIADATVASDDMQKDNVYAYPNPVEPGYTGLITVVGLSFDADVKILTSSGRLVAQGRSNGGTFTWDGCDQQGKRVASGVYMVAAATSDGNKGIVCKLAIIN